VSDYKEGDLIEAVKGETVVRGRVIINPLHIAAIECQPGISWLEENGFTITVIEKAEPQVNLPSEQGFYSTANGEVWEVDEDGEFKSTRRGTYLSPNGASELRALEAVAPFTRLEPRAVTAKAASEWLWAHRRELIAANHSDDVRSLLIDFDSEFGVTND
jgi:hypothetical protein